MVDWSLALSVAVGILLALGGIAAFHVVSAITEAAIEAAGGMFDGVRSATVARVVLGTAFAIAIIGVPLLTILVVFEPPWLTDFLR